MEGALEGRGPDPEAQKASKGPSGWWKCPQLLPQSSSPRGSPVLLSSSPPTQYQCSWRGSWKVEHQAQEPSRLPRARLGGRNARCTSPHHLIPEGPPLLPLLLFPFLCLSYTPKTQTVKGGLLQRRTRPRSPAGFPGPDWSGETLGTLPPDPLSHRGPLQAWESLLSPSHTTRTPVLSSLHFYFPLTLPHVLPIGSGVPPFSLGIEVPHQHPAGTLVVGKCKLRVLPRCHLDLCSVILIGTSLYVFCLEKLICNL